MGSLGSSRRATSALKHRAMTPILSCLLNWIGGHLDRFFFVSRLWNNTQMLHKLPGEPDCFNTVDSCILPRRIALPFRFISPWNNSIQQQFVGCHAKTLQSPFIAGKGERKQRMLEMQHKLFKTSYGKQSIGMTLSQDSWVQPQNHPLKAGLLASINTPCISQHLWRNAKSISYLKAAGRSHVVL